ncbi:MAG: hypothetical protein K2X32_12075, partial [Phycisphaerales bacterium]|nr:hypothetical protein [Phycisphaerales bacterium]
MAKAPRASKSSSKSVAGEDAGGLLGASTSAAASPRPSATVTQDGVVELPAFKRLSEIVGQRHAVSVLRSAIDTGRVHHAWIFSGPRGVGKFTTARAFAAELLSRAEAGAMPPEVAEEIIGLVASARHSDVHVVSKELASVSREKTVRDSKQTTVAKA